MSGSGSECGGNAGRTLRSECFHCFCCILQMILADHACDISRCAWMGCISLLNGFECFWNRFRTHKSKSSNYFAGYDHKKSPLHMEIKISRV